jgi:hypothetical protein
MLTSNHEDTKITKTHEEKQGREMRGAANELPMALTLGMVASPLRTHIPLLLLPFFVCLRDLRAFVVRFRVSIIR